MDRIAELAVQYGGKIDSGPQLFPISSTYYAVLFQDPYGNKYEMVHRLNGWIQNITQRLGPLTGLSFFQ
ncbi:hypothetical protein [Paenibacillus spongiae]|uniref:hypothetical protein n=1 Tax=Paenibacillus spongiae TaxID=2909671 RepID=UPI0035A23C4D